MSWFRFFSKTNKIIIYLSLLVSIFVISDVNAATMSLYSQKNQIETGGSFTLQVLVNTDEKFINNAEASIVFPSDLLEVVSISDAQSIFNLWVEKPSFSNITGTINFNGGLPNPGFKGSSGHLISAVIRAKKSGNAKIVLSNASIRENDGLGTDILYSLTNAEVVVKDSASEKINEIKSNETKASGETITGGQLGLLVSSPSHPDQNLWYSSNNVVLVWKNNPGTRAIRTGISRRYDSTPNTVVPASTDRRDLNGLDEGTLYFLIRYQNQKGWSEVSSYKLNIDISPPKINSLQSYELEDGSVDIAFNAEDDISGVDHYDLSVDNHDSIKIFDISASKYNFRLNPGKHEIKLSVFDKAGNLQAEVLGVNVEATASPEIKYYSKNIFTDSSVYLLGSSIYTNQNIHITQRSTYGVLKEYEIKTDNLGKFAFMSEPLTEDGVYEYWISVVNYDGTKGPSTEKIQVIVQKESIINKIINNPGSIFELKQFWLIFIAVIGLIGWLKYVFVNIKYSALMNDVVKAKNKTKKALYKK